MVAGAVRCGAATAIRGGEIRAIISTVGTIPRVPAIGRAAVVAVRGVAVELCGVAVALCGVAVRGVAAVTGAVMPAVGVMTRVPVMRGVAPFARTIAVVLYALLVVALPGAVIPTVGAIPRVPAMRGVTTFAPAIAFGTLGLVFPPGYQLSPNASTAANCSNCALIFLKSSLSVTCPLKFAKSAKISSSANFVLLVWVGGCACVVGWVDLGAGARRARGGGEKRVLGEGTTDDVDVGERGCRVVCECVCVCVCGCGCVLVDMLVREAAVDAFGLCVRGCRCVREGVCVVVSVRKLVCVVFGVVYDVPFAAAAGKNFSKSQLYSHIL